MAMCIFHTLRHHSAHFSAMRSICRAIHRLSTQCPNYRAVPVTWRCYSKDLHFHKKLQISIEGNIGSGKTTFLNNISTRFPNIEVLPEPLHKWKSLKGGNVLDLLYSDPNRWSFAFQSYVLLSMLRIHHHQPQMKPFRLIERSVFSASYCFVENLYRSKLMTEVEYSIYHEWFQWMLDFERPKVDLIIYLRTSPEKCYERVQERSRKEESTVALDLLEQIHGLHEEWLIDKSSHPVPAPVMVIDGNRGKDELNEFYKNNGEDIFGFAKSSAEMSSLG